MRYWEYCGLLQTYKVKGPSPGRCRSLSFPFLCKNVVALLFRCHLLNPVEGTFYCRDAENQYRDYTFNQNIGVVIDNRINRGQCLREVFRHVVHPVQVAAQRVEGTPEEDAEKIALNQPVFLSGKKARKPQCGKCKKVITAHLERSQYVGTAALDELQDTVSKRYGKSGAKSVPVAHKTDKQHAEQGNGAAPRKLIRL